jgi:hypothetical protein
MPYVLVTLCLPFRCLIHTNRWISSFRINRDERTTGYLESDGFSVKVWLMFVDWKTEVFERNRVEGDDIACSKDGSRNNCQAE